MRGNKTRGRIATNCCVGVWVHDVITCADLYYDRLRVLGVAGGQILGFSIDLLRRPYNTLALPCECVISGNSKMKNDLENEVNVKKIKSYNTITASNPLPIAQHPSAYHELCGQSLGAV